MNDIFIVTSHGWSGSNWLANTLNDQPEVYCTHMVSKQVPQPDDCDEKFSKNRRFDLIRKGMINRQRTSIDNMVSNLATNTKKPLIGNVGMYRLRDLPWLAKKYGPPSRPLTIINLIRNPISVIISGFGQFKRRFNYDICELQWNINKLINNHYEYIMDVSQAYSIQPGKIQNISFFAAIQALNSLRLDIEAQKQVSLIKNITFLGNIKMEEITTSAQQLGNLFKMLVPSCSITPKSLNLAINRGAINIHNQNSPRYAAQKFAALEQWQQRSLLHFWDTNTLEPFYRKEGYEFSFLARLKQR